MKYNKTLFALIFLFFLAFFLRFYLLPQNLFFGPEQGIDFLVIRDIAVNHKLTLIGAKTDVSGVFHGPIYYYLAVIPFILSQGNPLFISLFLIVLNTLSVFFMYYLGKIIGGERFGIIAAIIFTVSFQAVVYPRWLSSHPLAIPLSCLFFIFFYRFLKGSKKDLVFASVALGLLNQAEFLHIIFFSTITIMLFLFYFKNFRKENPIFVLLCTFIAVALTGGTYILFDLKHGFLISKNLLSLAAGSTGYHISIAQAIIDIWNSIIRVFMRTILPVSFIGSLILFLTAIILLIQKIVKKEKNFFPLLIWFVIPLVLLIVFRHNILDQFFVSFIPLFVLITALVIDFLWQKKQIFGFILLAFIIVINLFTWWRNIPTNQNVFFQSTQPDLRYSDELGTLDDIYKQADKKPFSFQSYTIPYWTQQGWQYLFWSYGRGKYGYEPINQNAKTLFVIIQDDPSNKQYQSDWLKNTVSKWGIVKGTFKHGIITTMKLEVNK